MSERGRIYGCPECTHIMSSHDEDRCWVTGCDCKVRVKWPKKR